MVQGRGEDCLGAEAAEGDEDDVLACGVVAGKLNGSSACYYQGPKITIAGGSM